MANPAYEDTLPEEETVPKYEDTLEDASDISSAESAVAGARQGATLGFSDEIGGGIQAGLDKLLGGVSDVDAELAAQGFEGSLLPDASSVYKQARDENRAIDKAAEAANPGAYFAGELGGGLVSGGGLAKAGILKSTNLAKNAPMIQKMIASGKLGAKAGAAAGLGASESEDATGMAVDTAIGAGLGGVLGSGIEGGIGGVKKGLSVGSQKLGELVDKFKIGRQAKRSYDLGKMGQGISSEADQNKFANRVNKEAQKLTNYILDKVEENHKLKVDKLQGKSIDFTEMFQQAEQEIDNAVEAFSLDPESAVKLKEMISKNLYKQLPGRVEKTAISTIKLNKDGAPITTEKLKLKGDMSKAELESAFQMIGNENFTPSQSSMTVSPGSLSSTETALSEGVARGEIPAEKAAQIVRNLQRAAFEKRIANPGEASVMKGLAKRASDLIKQEVPETASLTKKMATGLETLEQIGEPELIRNIEGRTKVASDKATNFINDLSKSGDPNKLKQQNTVFGLLKEINPEYAKRFENRARNVALDQSLVKTSSTGGVSGLGQIVGSIKSGGLKLTNLAGQAVRGAEKGVIKVGYLAGVPTQRLQQASVNLMSNPDKNSQRLGKMLETVATSPEQKRAAMLFSISQNKDFRELLQNSLGAEETEQQE